MEIYIPLTALAIDTLIGDPRSRWHPVVIIGNLIAFFEARLLKSTSTARTKNFAGFLLVIIVLALIYVSVYMITLAFSYINPLSAFICNSVLLSFTISPRSLAEAGSEIKSYLLTNDLEQARFKVGWIVGRDTNELNTAEISRATIETVAENIVDGIISPLFYFFIGGVPLAFLYRAVNTLDSMVGYKNEKYLDFGMPAARVDDIFNYIPARITGILILVASFLLRFNTSAAFRSIIRDASNHPSPNSGIAEAGVAGALGIRLGGQNYYGGVSSFRAYMGEPINKLEPSHIDKTIKIMYVATFIFIAAITLAMSLQ